MAVLPKEQRAVIEMASYEGFSMQEIAQRTGVSFANVRHHYYRGLKKLRSLISERTDKMPSRRGGDCA